MSFYIDTHCHLDLDAFDEDRQAVIERALSAGVGLLINPGINVLSSRSAIHLAETYTQIYAAIGLHPNDISADWRQEITELETMIPHPKVVAIGEIGLDRYHKDVPMEIQIPALKVQLDLALSNRLPVILHSRETLPELFPILSEWSTQCIRAGWKPPYGVLHSFEGDFQAAGRFIDLGFLIGLAGPVTYKNAADKHALAAGIPLDRVLFETDSPFLPPTPYRGRRNEPAYLPQIGQRTAIIKKCDEIDVVDATTQNAITLFRFGVT